MSSTAAQPSPDASGSDMPIPKATDRLAGDNPAGDTLPGLRAEIDGIDDALHDLLMRRAAVVERVGRLRKVAFRPGREAGVIRRLIGRHTGPLPPHTLVRLWREIFAGHVSIETPFAIAVCEAGSSDPADKAPFAAVAREHFGALTPLCVHHTPAQAIAEVSAGRATVAVLPMPLEEEPPSAAWWVALLHGDEPRIHVVARLPFWAPRPEGAVSTQALVVAANAPDPSGDDRGLLGLELPAEMNRAFLASALAATGFSAGGILLRRDPKSGFTYALADLDGALSEGDQRLAALANIGLRPVVLGGYAVPVEIDGA